MQKVLLLMFCLGLCAYVVLTDKPSSKVVLDNLKSIDSNSPEISNGKAKEFSDKLNTDDEFDLVQSVKKRRSCSCYKTNDSWVN